MLLEVTQGLAVGRRFELAGPVVTLGRSEGNEIVLEDVVVSARHASIVVGLDGATLEDLGSTNGTAVLRGGERLVATDLGERIALQPDDLIELGSGEEVCRLRVLIPEPAKPTLVVAAKRVDELTPETADLGKDPLAIRRLYEAQCSISRAGELSAVLEAIAAAVFKVVTHATHVTVVLRSDGGAEETRTGNASRGAPTYLPVLTRARDGVAGPSGQAFLPVTRSVYRKVLQERTAVLAADAPKEVGASASIMKASVRSTIALPLWRGDEILGVLQVDNRDAPGMLKDRDLDVLLLLTEPASLAVANAGLIGRLRAAEDKLQSENRFLRSRARERHRGASEGPANGIIGQSPAMTALLERLGRVVDTNVTVLIEGETGTGKELVASAVHYQSRRRDKLFVAQNCAAIAETLLESELFGHRRGAFTGATEDKKGLFELADGGTLFLDEITEAPMAIQSKLLRVLQEGEVRPVGASEARHVRVRVVAATNRDLDAEVAAGRFREDLYYRLKVFPLRVPPLRERLSDVPLLAGHFLERYASEFGKAVAGFAPEALELMAGYDWPGNVRELQNEVQRLVIEVEPGGFVTADLVSPRIRRVEQLLARAGAVRGSLRDTMAAVERHLVHEALRQHGNNKTAAAKALGITREGLHKKLRGLEGD